MYNSEGGKLPLRGQHMIKLGRVAAALATAFAAAGPVQAFEIDTGNEDLVVRWDNTLRYTYGVRMQGQNSGLLGRVDQNDGNYNFSKHRTVANRADILSEFDIVYQGRHGMRVSAAGWYDYAYANIDGNTNNATPNQFQFGTGRGATQLTAPFKMSGYTDRYNHGPSGEWLDAFLFTGFDIGDVAVNMKLGQHTIIWGEPLLVGGTFHSVSYSQSRLDLGKAQTNPGIEAKELFMPIGNFSMSVQATPELTFSAQYFYDWAGTRVPEGGTYLGANDQLMFGGQYLRALGPLLPRLNNNWPKDSGDWGVSARWSPEWADATIGFYYRNFTDKLPGLFVDARALPGTPGRSTNPSQLGYGISYGDNVDLFGISLSKQVFGVSWGAELSARRNMPLVSDPLVVVTQGQRNFANSAQGAALGASRALIATGSTTYPGEGDSATARGNTWHGLINAVGSIATTPLFDSATYQAELTWSTWTSVTDNAYLFKGRNSYLTTAAQTGVAGYTPIDKPTKNAIGVGFGFTPTWYQVFPSVDITLPMSVNWGLHGNSVVSSGGNEGAGSYAIGVGAVYLNKYLFDLRWIDYFGNTSTNPLTGAVTQVNGANSVIADRGWLVFNFKTTF